MSDEAKRKHEKRPYFIESLRTVSIDDSEQQVWKKCVETEFENTSVAEKYVRDNFDKFKGEVIRVVRQCSKFKVKVIAKTTFETV